MHSVKQRSGTVHLKRAGMNTKSHLYFIVSLLCCRLEEAIKEKALKECLCCTVPNARALNYETHVSQWAQSIYRKD